MEKSARPRIPIKVKPVDETVTVDSLEFTANKCTPNARIVRTVDEQIAIELWYDKHYLDRQQHGDESGRRIGIDTQVVEDLVTRSIKHLLFYGAYIKNFCFLNHGQPIGGGRAIRIVCQQETENGLLNVVIEAHFKALNLYEVTVKTAMCIEDFAISDGQYAIELFSDMSSTLKFMSRGKLNEVFTI